MEATGQAGTVGLCEEPDHGRLRVPVEAYCEALAGGLKNFRLPGGYESDRYRLKLAGTGRFRELRVAQSFRELSSL